MCLKIIAKLFFFAKRNVQKFKGAPLKDIKSRKTTRKNPINYYYNKILLKKRRPVFTSFLKTITNVKIPSIVKSNKSFIKTNLVKSATNIYLQNLKRNKEMLLKDQKSTSTKKYFVGLKRKLYDSLATYSFDDMR